MNKDQYCEEALSECLTEHAPDVKLSSEALSKIAHDLVYGLDMWDECGSGDLNIPNPLVQELAQERKRREDEKRTAENNQRAILDAWCYCEGMRPGSLVFNHGRVEILR